MGRVSNCCGASGFFHEDYGICSDCLEHCDYVCEDCFEELTSCDELICENCEELTPCDENQRLLTPDAVSRLDTRCPVPGVDRVE